MIRKLDERTLVSGQIGPDDVARLKDQGVTMIVCNRPDGDEVGQPRAADIEQAANEAGIEFRFAPIIRGIGPSDAEAMQEAIEQAWVRVWLPDGKEEERLIRIGQNDLLHILGVPGQA